MTSDLVVMAANAGFDFNTIFTIVGGGAGAAAAWKFVTLLGDKLIPNRSDKRSDVESTFKVLSDALDILRKDKAEDAKYLGEKQARIAALETDADRDYTELRSLRAERDELEERLRRKEEHLQQLIDTIRKLGAAVTFDGDGTLHVTLPPDLEERRPRPEPAVREKRRA